MRPGNLPICSYTFFFSITHNFVVLRTFYRQRKIKMKRYDGSFTLKLVILTLIVFLCSYVTSTSQQEHDTAQLPDFPNIDYFFVGYDIVKGSPLSNFADPGFRTPIWNMTFGQNKTFDQKFRVPDNTNVLPQSACTYTGLSSSLGTGYNYQQNLQLSGSISFPDNSIPYISSLIQSLSTGSPDFSSKYSHSGYTNNVYISTTIQCITYNVQLLPGNYSLPLSLGFQQLVAQIDPSIPSTILDFIQAFGTSYISKMNMGGNSIAYSTVETDVYYTLVEKKNQHTAS